MRSSQCGAWFVWGLVRYRLAGRLLSTLQTHREPRSSSPWIATDFRGSRNPQADANWLLLIVIASGLAIAAGFGISRIIDSNDVVQASSQPSPPDELLPSTESSPEVEQESPWFDGLGPFTAGMSRDEAVATG